MAKDRSALPAQVRKIAEAADAFQEALVNPPGEEGAVLPVEGAVPPVEGEVPVAPVVEGETPIPAGGVAVPPVEPVVVPDPLEQQFAVLKGKYDAEVPRLSEDKKVLLAKLESAEQFIREKLTAPVPAVTIEPVLDPDEEEIKKAYPDIYSFVDKLRREVRAETKVVKTMATTSAGTSFEDALSKEVPNWREVDTDPDFHAWLRETDRYTGVPKMNLLQGASSHYDVVRTAYLFKDFIDGSAKYKGNAGAGQEVPPAPAGAAGMAKYVAPASAKAGGVPPPDPVKKTFKKIEIDKYYQDLALKRIHPTSEERAVKEREIWEAMQEGRVT